MTTTHINPNAVPIKRLPAAERRAIMSHALKYGEQGFKIETEAKRLWKMLAKYHKGKALPHIVVTPRGVKVRDDGTLSEPTQRDMAYVYSNEIHISANVGWEDLAHELVHCAVGFRRDNKNGKKCAHDRTFYHCLRDLTQRRFKCTISFFEVTSYGYAVDRLIKQQLIEQDAYRIFLPKEKQS
jgi:hypothetical protein